MRLDRTILGAIVLVAASCGGTMEPGGDAGTDAGTDTGTDAAADPGGCTAGALRCAPDGSGIERCSSDGASWVPVSTCDEGCGDDPEPHCLSWIPSNLPDDTLLDAAAPPTGPAPPLDPETEYWVDLVTDTGEIVVWSTSAGWTHVLDWRPEGEGLDASSGIHFEVVPQGSGLPDLGVFSFLDIEIPAGTVWAVAGTLPLVLLSAGDASIEGGVFAGCQEMEGPTMGGASGSGEGPGTGTPGTSVDGPEGVRDGGGGGAGYGGPGGTAGGWAPETRGRGGPVHGNPVIIPLVAGSGGAPGAGTGWGRQGGRSGGAVIVVAGGTLHLTGTGFVDAGGCGGQPSYYDNEAGGGGGSGGSIILEAPHLVVVGAVTVNGGGGAGGGTDAQPGQHGQWQTDEAAHGGEPGGSYGCDGGAGSGSGDASGGDAPTCDASEWDYNAGGGGGGSGRIRLNGESRSIDGLLSPPLGSGATTEGPLPLG